MIHTTYHYDALYRVSTILNIYFDKTLQDSNGAHLNCNNFILFHQDDLIILFMLLTAPLLEMIIELIIILSLMLLNQYPIVIKIANINE